MASLSLDEPALAQDLVRLLGAELQRVKRELAEEKACSTAVLKAVDVKRENTPGVISHSLCEERIQALRAENESHETEIYALRARLDTVLGKNSTLEVYFDEIKYDNQKLREELESTQHTLGEAELYARGLLHKIDNMDKELNAMYDRKDRHRESDNLNTQEILDGDPFTFINDLPATQDKAIMVYKPYAFCKDDNSPPFLGQLAIGISESTLGINYSKTLSRSDNSQQLFWAPKRPLHGMTVEPAFKYCPLPRGDVNTWAPNTSVTANGKYELFIGRQGYWYYLGTYETTVFKVQSKRSHFSTLLNEMQDELLKHTLQAETTSAPLVQTVKNLYEVGALPFYCVVHERVGFKKSLRVALECVGNTTEQAPDFCLGGVERGNAKRKGVTESTILRGKRAKMT